MLIHGQSADGSEFAIDRNSLGFDAIRHAQAEIKARYGHDTVIQGRTLRKFGRSQTVGTGRATIMTLPAGETAETQASSDVALSVVSGSASDTSRTVDLIEGHTSSDGNLTFATVNPAATLTGQTPVSLGVSRTRLTRAKLSVAAVGSIYFYETGTTVTAGVPQDSTKIYLIVPPGEPQSQKASTAISSTQYWVIVSFTVGILDKTAAFVQARIETKTWNASTWYPSCEWLAVNTSSGSKELLSDRAPPIIIQANSDVRISAIADGANTDVVGGMAGYLLGVI